MTKPFKSKKKRPAWKQSLHKIKKRQQKNRLRPLAYEPQKRVETPGLFSSWKIPSLMGVGGLIAVILFIPALIVIPFIDAESAKAPVEETAASVEKTDGENVDGTDDFDQQLSVSVMRDQTDKVEEMPLEEYVTGVVSAEMPADFQKEALKAQALAARTYIVNRLMNQLDDEGDASISDTVDDQVYKNEDELRERWGDDYNWKIERVNDAVASTQGEVLTYDDITITPAFFSTSNGYTENSEDYWDSELPYLRSVESPWDTDSPKFLDQETFTTQEIEETLGVQLPHEGEIPMKITRTDSSRVETLQLGEHSFTGRTVREKLGLRSSDFNIKHKNDHYIFTTKGFGHGIGMSQYGANGMAKEGKTYKEIVGHYYQGIEISALEKTASKLVMADGKQ